MPKHSETYRCQSPGLLVTVGKPERSLRRLFQAAVEIIKKKWPKATAFDFHRLRQFPQAFLFLSASDPEL